MISVANTRRRKTYNGPARPRVDDLREERHVSRTLVSHWREREREHHNFELAGLLVLEGAQLNFILLLAAGRQAGSLLEELLLPSLDDICGLRASFLKRYHRNTVYDYLIVNFQ